MAEFKKLKNFFSAVQNKKIKVAGKLHLTGEDKRAFTETTRQEDIRTYRESMDLPEELKCTHGLSEFLGNRTSSIETLARLKKKQGEENVPEIMAGQGTFLEECLNHAEGGPHIRALSDAFAPVTREGQNADGEAIVIDTLQEARHNYERRLQKLDELARRDPPKFNFSAMAGYIKAEQKIAIDVIKAQQTAEVDRLTRALKSPPDGTLNDALITALRLQNGDPAVQENNIRQFRENLLASVQKSHNEQLSNFKKSIDKDVEMLHELAELNGMRLNVLSQLSQRSKAMRKKINDLQPNEPAPDNEEGNVEIEINAGNSARFKGIKVTDAIALETILGRSLEYDDSTKTFSMNLPWVNPFYYRRSGRLQSDLDSMAYVIRGSGKKEITFTVNYANEKYAMEVARMQYLAACRAGFNPEATKKEGSDEAKSAITIKVNGKEMKPEDLFKEHSNEWDRAKGAYKDQKRKAQNYAENHPSMRQEIENIRTTVERELAVAPQQQGQQAANQGQGPNLA